MARPLRGSQDLDEVLASTSSARYVLIGEASHGTSEFYAWRAELTKRLIAEQGFSFVAVEGDWPDCHRLHCCVAGAPGVANDPAAVLWEFERWPRWMWANEEVVDFARWLRGFNASRTRPVGFHGLDVYSLWDSLHAVLAYLRAHDPDRVDAALEAYRCFEPYTDPQEYAFATRIVPENCEQDVVRMLAELRPPVAEDSLPGLDPAFVAWQNAEVVAGAERYYREMVRGGGRSWNVRDRHMTDTLDRVMSAYGSKAKAVVWAHNTHVGDARATDMAAAGMVNIGQLVRERHALDGVMLIGFGSHRGSVIASDFWGGPMCRMPVPDARSGSVEDLLHEAVPDSDSLFVFPDSSWASQVRGHRAIGVVYHPNTERAGNYVPTVLDQRYDAFVHCDHTEALNPLHQFEHAQGELRRVE
ncbi:protein-L-isoaspartate O-methyltransferase [Kibdelosporangium aridum]|uniref:Protein-L-isoaspartate O-methyltransferase n=2 Tax=Kibdelosporangium aridum TaxID=2030 RepID=A0A428ZE03_KIBAR|nr:protein-L-isoaspartate O-methyltransferase [Kibdelosporangium aridum]